MSLAQGLINEIERMGGSDVWMLMRPNAIGVSYARRGTYIKHSVMLPFGEPSDSALACLLELADDDLAD